MRYRNRKHYNTIVTKTVNIEKIAAVQTHNLYDFLIRHTI